MIRLLIFTIFWVALQALNGEEPSVSNNFARYFEKLRAIKDESELQQAYLALGENRKERIITFLTQNSDPKDSQILFSIISMAGDDSDVEVIEVYLNRMKEKCSNVVLIYFAVDALGVMQKRGSKKAAELLSRASNPLFWKGSTFKIRAPTKLPTLQLEFEMAQKALWSRVNAQEANIEDLIRKWLIAVSPEDQRMLAEKECLDMLREVERLKLNSQERNSPSGNTIKASSDWTGVILLEATSRLEKMCNELLSKDFESCSKWILDDGKTMIEKFGTDTIQKLKSMEHSFDKTINVIGKIKNNDGSFDYGAGTVSKMEEIVFSKVQIKDSKSTTDVISRIVVRIELLDTEQVVKDLKMPPNAITRSKSGLLVVYMVHENGKWYWNPFGW